jgi:hypothetical protein
MIAAIDHLRSCEARVRDTACEDPCMLAPSTEKYIVRRNSNYGDEDWSGGVEYDLYQKLHDFLYIDVDCK